MKFPAKIYKRTEHILEHLGDGDVQFYLAFGENPYVSIRLGAYSIHISFSEFTKLCKEFLYNNKTVGERNVSLLR